MVASVESDPTLSGDADARRFLRIFATVTLVVVALIAGFNRYVYTQLLRPENQTIVQLAGGWSRVYKPILFDRFQPEVAVFGASWARDAFDPALVAPLTGRSWFNHAVSGSSAYEARRFIESSLDDPQLRVVILNLDTFLVPDVGVRRKKGFDETLLDRDAKGNPTTWLPYRRAFAVTLSGAAIGNGLDVLRAISKRNAGADIAEYVDSYDHFDLAAYQGAADRVRVLLPGLAGQPPAGPDLANLPLPPGAPELQRVLATLCARDLEVHGYFTPMPVVLGEAPRGLAETLHGLELFRRAQPGCRARLKVWNFNYPNAVTLDGLRPGPRWSTYYRSDGHPRPTIGLLMAARMFNQPFPAGTAPEISADFGVELLGAPDGEARLRRTADQLARLNAVVRNTSAAGPART